MSFIKSILLLFNKIFKKESNMKMLEEPAKEETLKKKSIFMDSLKVNIIKKKKEVRTLTCTGDGLGIQTKITY